MAEETISKMSEECQRLSEVANEKKKETKEAEQALAEQKETLRQCSEVRWNHDIRNLRLSLTCTVLPLDSENDFSKALEKQHDFIYVFFIVLVLCFCCLSLFAI